MEACGQNGIMMEVPWNQNGSTCKVEVDIDFTVEIQLKEVAHTNHHKFFNLI